MQNLWKHIDSILGKGYGMLDFVELLYYFGLAIIPLALPLTVLLSSVMVYGDMAEKHELSSAKSSGISFIRMLKPGLVISIGIFFLSIFSANFLKPEANRGFFKKIRDMKTNKLTFAFDEKIFNREFKDFSIRIGSKDKDGKSIDDILIYDHTDADHSVLNMIRAQKGEMYTSSDQKFLIMDLEDGYQVREIREESADRLRKGHNAFARPVTRYKFSSLRKIFNLSDMLDLNKVNVDYKKYEMMNTMELVNEIDSLTRSAEKPKSENIYEFVLFANRDTANKSIPPDIANNSNNTNRASGGASLKAPDRSSTKRRTFSAKGLANRQRIREAQRKAKSNKYESIVKIFPERLNEKTKSIWELAEVGKQTKLLELMKKNTMALMTNNNNHKQEVRMIMRNRDKYVLSLHQIYSWATVCIIFLFIGAPAGAIVRKGGFGYPLLIAIGFYLTFVMSTIIGKKLMTSGAVSPEVGAWLPCLLLVPFALYLSWRALHDNRPIILPFIKKIIGFVPYLNIKKGS